MVSEGVDVPRLAVGVYATTISTPLFFAQAVGRFVRSRRRGETASVFLPTIPMLLDFANEMEVERDHVLDKPKKDGRGGPVRRVEDRRSTRPNEEQDEDTGEQEQLPFEALESDAVFDRVLYDGAEFGMQAHPGSEEEQDYLGIPGLLEPDQVQLLLQKRQARQIAHSRKKPDEEADLLELPAERRPVVTHKELLELRKQLNTHGGGVRPPERQAARRDPHRAAPGVRRAAERGGDGRAAAAADREGAGVGHADAVRPLGCRGAGRSASVAALSRLGCVTGAAVRAARLPESAYCHGDHAALRGASCGRDWPHVGRSVHGTSSGPGRARILDGVFR